MDCMRCKRNYAFEAVAFNGIGYKAKVCADCCNDYHVFIRDNPLWLEMQDVKNALESKAIAMTGHPELEDTLLGAARIAQAANNLLAAQLFTIVDEWVKAGKP